MIRLTKLVLNTKEKDFMTQEKTLTGYPSIDKPWLKYYSEEAIKNVV